MKLKFQALLGALIILAEGGAAQTLAALGTSKDDWKVVAGDRPWVSTDVALVREVLDAITVGSMAMIGMPRVEVSAEYVAAVIAVIVHPVNINHACFLYEGHLVTNQELAFNEKPSPTAERVSKEQLMALVELIYGHGITLNEYKGIFEKEYDRQVFKDSNPSTDVA